jgi:hypothetical protein
LLFSSCYWLVGARWINTNAMSTLFCTKKGKVIINFSCEHPKNL